MKMTNNLLSEERVVRCITHNKLRKDAQDNILGVTGAAFELKDKEEYLSGAWCEFFNGLPQETLRCTVESLRASSYIPARNKKTRFAVAEAGNIRSFMFEAKRPVRIIHSPSKGNPAYAEIHISLNDDKILLERIADEVWGDLYTQSQINDMPKVTCQISDRGKASNTYYGIS